MPIFTDGLGRRLHLSQTPKRIVSLVPSQTELLYTLGLEDEVVGITKFCVHPSHWRKTKKIIGGTKGIHQESILDLKPDLIIANKEENVQAQVEALYDDVPVWVSDVADLQDALQMIKSVGALTGKESNAADLVKDIRTRFEKLTPMAYPLRVAYLIWKDPYMTVGRDTFIHHLLLLAGFQNVFDGHTRYPALSEADLVTAAPDVVMLSSEPYPFKSKHIAPIHGLLPKATILLTEGELLSWYGSRLLHTPDYLQNLQRLVSNKVTA